MAPLLADARRGAPDRRDVSIRWLSGTFLTGITSTVLMGAALFAALDGRDQLATPAELVAVAEPEPEPADDLSGKGPRVASVVTRPVARDRRRMEISTVTRVGDADMIRMRPFQLVRMSLAANHPATGSYPRFDPMAIFSSGDAGPASAEAEPQLYGTKVESDVAIRSVDFPLTSGTFERSAELALDEVEDVVRKTGALLTDGAVQVASLYYVDPFRFGSPEETLNLGVGATAGVRIVTENVSTAEKVRGEPAVSYSEDLITLPVAERVDKALERAGYDDESARTVADLIAERMSTRTLNAGTAIRIAIETDAGVDRIVRASLYSGDEHLLSVARLDDGSYGKGDAPTSGYGGEIADEVAAPVPTVSRRDLPSVYDAVYRAAQAYDMTQPMTAQLVRMFAGSVDLESRVKPADTVDVFFSLPEEGDAPDEESDILFVRARFGGDEHRFYRFVTEDGGVDYFDQDGRSSRQFMLRNPVPKGKFRSPFGMRRHPILGYRKMHWGVDWSAPRGTPIIASANGTVEKAGWASGYGKQTVIRHANGYVTSYSHQSDFAKGIRPGARVRQGQVIGYVGTTGLSTGPHLHYEMEVNGTKVDPLRIRLPVGKVLKGSELAEFTRERERIDKLLADEMGEGTEVASR